MSKGTLSGQGGERYTWRYRLPTGVSCNRCVLQVCGAAREGGSGWQLGSRQAAVL